MHPETITIPYKDFIELVDAADMLSALESAGVDNWDGYSNALEILEEMRAEEQPEEG